jgi:pimeloyl-ACP methyl ester carboxylesterase
MSIRLTNSNTKSAVLLLHGFPEDASLWDDYLTPLSISHSLLVLDSRDPPEIESLVIDILRNLRAAKATELHIVCHDIGGYLATAILPYLKNETKTLCFVSASFPKLLLYKCKQPKQVLKSWYTLFFQIPVVSDWFWKTFASRLAKTLYPKDAKHLQNLENHTTWIKLYRQAFKDLFTLKQEKITTPTLFIETTDDSFLQVHAQDELEAFFVRVEHRVVTGDHWFVKEDPKKVIQMLNSFWEKTNG